MSCTRRGNASYCKKLKYPHHSKSCSLMVGYVPDYFMEGWVLLYRKYVTGIFQRWLALFWATAGRGLEAAARGSKNTERRWKTSSTWSCPRCPAWSTYICQIKTSRLKRYPENLFGIFTDKNISCRKQKWLFRPRISWIGSSSVRNAFVSIVNPQKDTKSLMGPCGMGLLI